jgi:hypothetical protein
VVAADASGTSGTSVNAAKLQPDVQYIRIDGCRYQALCPSGPFGHVRHISVAWSALGSIRNVRHRKSIAAGLMIRPCFSRFRDARDQVLLEMRHDWRR